MIRHGLSVVWEHRRKNNLPSDLEEKGIIKRSEPKAPTDEKRKIRELEARLNANSLLKLGNNPLANRILKSMGINIRIGSRAASNLGRAIYDSGKFFTGLLIENIGCNSVNNGLLIVFD